MKITSPENYREQYKNSLEKPEAYWATVAENYEWFKKWDKIASGDFAALAAGSPPLRWFEGAELNITVNALDRHLKTQGDKVAVYFEPNDPKDKPTTHTYKQLHEQVCRFSNVLKKHGVKKGDVVCFYMAMTPELLFGLLACARIGAVHSVVFAGFSAASLASRIQDSSAKILFTNDEGLRGDKKVDLKKIADEALQTCPTVKRVIVHKRTGAAVPFRDDRDVWLETEMKSVSNECAPEKIGAEDPLFLLYTSGSTGKPKGLLHTTAGYMVWVSETFKNVFQCGPQDIYWCTADLGWVTGHSYIAYGPLVNGATQVIFEGVPTWPDAGRFWQIVDKYKVSHFYTAPTAIRALEAMGLDFVKPYSLASLKVLGSVGEPINEEAWSWYNDNIGKKKCPIVDTWWQTETGGIMISSMAGITPSVATMATLPLPGVQPALIDGDGKVITAPKAEGSLCIQRPWPGIARTIYGDHKRYLETYFSTHKGFYFTGDGAKRDAKGNYRIIGRIDDVVNVSGHRIGTAEVEDAVNQHPAIVESAVVGIPHAIKGQGLAAFAIAGGAKFSDEKTLLKEVNDLLTKLIGPIAKLDALILVKGLPKTRSGKIMRRILRKAAAGEKDNLGDTSTLLNPEVVAEILAKAASIQK